MVRHCAVFGPFSSSNSSTLVLYGFQPPIASNASEQVSMKTEDEHFVLTRTGAYTRKSVIIITWIDLIKWTHRFPYLSTLSIIFRAVVKTQINVLIIIDDGTRSGQVIKW